MREENDKNSKASRERRYKLLNWNVHVEKTEAYFRSVADAANAAHFFETLFVDRDDEHRTIQLHAGKHPIGERQTIRDGLGRATGWRIDVEHGAALVISQSALGNVAILLYPYRSENVQRVESHIIWAILDSPAELTESILRSAVADFFIYVRVSSALFNESALDRWRIRYLELRGRKYKEGRGIAHVLFSHWFWIYLGAAGSIASIYYQSQGLSHRL